MFIPHGTLIMVADGANRALFRNRGKDYALDLELVDELEHPAPRTSEIGTGKPGRSFQSMGPSRGAHPGTDFHQQEEDRFATEAAEQLNKCALEAGAGLILIAAPRFLGAMRKHLRTETRNKLLAEIDKDYAGRPAKDIARLLGQYESG